MAHRGIRRVAWRLHDPIFATRLRSLYISGRNVLLFSASWRRRRGSSLNEEQLALRRSVQVKGGEEGTLSPEAAAKLGSPLGAAGPDVHAAAADGLAAEAPTLAAAPHPRARDLAPEAQAAGELHSPMMRATPPHAHGAPASLPAPAAHARQGGPPRQTGFFSGFFDSCLGDGESHHHPHGDEPFSCGPNGYAAAAGHPDTAAVAGHHEGYTAVGLGGRSAQTSALQVEGSFGPRETTFGRVPATAPLTPLNLEALQSPSASSSAAAAAAGRTSVGTSTVLLDSAVPATPGSPCKPANFGTPATSLSERAARATASTASRASSGSGWGGGRSRGSAASPATSPLRFHLHGEEHGGALRTVLATPDHISLCSFSQRSRSPPASDSGDEDRMDGVPSFGKHVKRRSPSLMDSHISGPEMEALRHFQVPFPEVEDEDGTESMDSRDSLR
eukprot:TRINITY_DN20150_c0_g2_i1.p1 TRINITY_DN20150_c0_g2~~TRINITY_DN20150_c0_g2_i1.p1  ORF type:complete len:446 (-),score=88.15 TRINITY_DN20150_c0_g2_i1:135-1472(-)